MKVPAFSRLTEVNTAYSNVFLDQLSTAALLPAQGAINAELGISYSMLGTLSSSTAMVTFLAAYITGIASDRYGHVFALRVATAFQIVSNLLMLHAVLAKSFVSYVFSRVVASLFRGSMVISQAYVVHHSKQVDISKNLGQLFAMSNLGFVFAPVIGGYLAGISTTLLIQFAIVVKLLSVILLYNIDTKTSASTDGTDELSSSNGSQAGKEESTPASVQSGKPQSSSCSPGVSVKEKYILHLRFFFQFTNSIYETLFVQRMNSELGITSQTIGWLLSSLGVISVMVNSNLQKIVQLLGKINLDVLLFSAAGFVVSTTGWALLNDVVTAFASTGLLCACSTLFTTVLQTKLAACASGASDGGDPHVKRKNSDDSLDVRETAVHSSTSPSSSSEATAGRAQTSTGAVIGLSAMVDRGARVVGPFIGGIALQHYGKNAFVAVCLLPAVYCWVALHFQFIKI
jgi:MFS family permease